MPPETTDATPSQETLGRMVAAVAHRLPDVALRTVQRARAELPAYGALGEDELLEGVQRDLALAVAALVEGRGFTAGDEAVLGTIGDTRAAQGLPLEGMLRVYRITVDEIFHELWRAAEAGDLRHDEVVSLTRRIWSYAGPMMDLATAAYRSREIGLALADSERRTGLVHELLLAPAAGAETRMTALGLDPLREHLAFRARPAGGDTSALLRELKLPGVLEGVVAPYEGDVVGVARRRPGLASGAWLAGVGPAGPPGALPASFALATRTLETAHAFGRRGVLALEDLPLHAVALAEGGLADLLHARCVAPVRTGARAGAADVLATVGAVLDHELSAEAAAETLGVHPNTVRNRLHRYEELTGMSLRRLDDLVQVRIALLRDELTGGAPPSSRPCP